jgi:hypothetical protein
MIIEDEPAGRVICGHCGAPIAVYYQTNLGIPVIRELGGLEIFDAAIWCGDCRGWTRWPKAASMEAI